MVFFSSSTSSVLGQRLRNYLPNSTPVVSDNEPLVTLAQLERYHNHAEKALTKTIREYEKLEGQDVDFSQWKTIRSKRGIRLFRDEQVVDGQQPTKILCVGTLHGRFQDVVEGLYCDNTEEMGLRNAIMCPRLTKSTVLHVVQKKTRREPYTFTGIKTVTLKSSLSSNREWCYFEKLGLIHQLRDDKQVAYHIMHSVDRPDGDGYKPPLKKVHASLCYVFEELEKDLVGVYMKGELEDTSFSYFTTLFMSDVLLAVVNALECTRAKKFTLKASASLPLVDRKATTRRKRCNVCNGTASFFDSYTLCAGCHMSVCKKCRFKEAILTRTTVASECPKRVDFCRDCIAAVNAVSIHQLRIEARETEFESVTNDTTIGMILEEIEDGEGATIEDSQRSLMSFVRNISAHVMVLSSHRDLRASTLSSIGVLSSSDEEGETVVDPESEGRDVLNSSRLKNSRVGRREKPRGEFTRRSRFSTTSTASCSREEDEWELYQSAIMTKLKQVANQAEKTLLFTREQSLVAHLVRERSQNRRVFSQ